MTRVVLSPTALKQLLESKSGAVAQDLDRRARAVQNQAIRLCPVNEGRLRGSISREIAVEPNGLTARVGTNVEYAMFVHEGTGLYGPRGRYIVPVKGDFLKWAATNNSGTGRRRYKGGKTQAYVYAKRSRGVRGRPFLRDALPAANN